MRLLAEGPGGGLDVLLADPLHDPLDLLLHARLLPQQDRVEAVRLRLPLAVQAVSRVVRVGTQHRPEIKTSRFGETTSTEVAFALPTLPLWIRFFVQMIKIV